MKKDDGIQDFNQSLKLILKSSWKEASKISEEEIGIKKLVVLYFRLFQAFLTYE